MFDDGNVAALGVVGTEDFDIVGVTEGRVLAYVAKDIDNRLNRSVAMASSLDAGRNHNLQRPSSYLGDGVAVHLWRAGKSTTYQILAPKVPIISCLTSHITTVSIDRG